MACPQSSQIGPAVRWTGGEEGARCLARVHGAELLEFGKNSQMRRRAWGSCRFGRDHGGSFQQRRAPR
jgi:hypothetical protein